MSFDSSKPPTDRLSDVEEGEINDEPTTAAKSHTKPDKSEPKNATPRSTSGNESINGNDRPATKAPRKRTLDGHDDDPFEEYERLARRRRRSSSRGSARRSSPRREHRRSASPYSSDDHRRPSRRSVSRDKRARYERDRFERRRYDSRSPRRVSPRRASPRRTSPRRSSQSRHRAPSSSRHPADKLPVKRTEPPTEPSNGTRQHNAPDKPAPTNEAEVGSKNQQVFDADLEIKDEHEKELEEQRLIEERRKRRRMIMERHKAKAPKAESPAVELEKSNGESTVGKATESTSKDVSMDRGGEDTMNDSPNAVSAADYDPSKDRIADDDRHRSLHGEKEELLKSKDRQESVTEGVTSQADMLATDYTEKLDNKPNDIDMFADDFDMFSNAEIPDPQALLVNTAATAAINNNPSLLDNWDDAEGYYNVRIGEVLDNRYQTLSNLGRGVFSAVVKARDLQTQEEVAIKIIRNNETMYKAGIKELGFLRKLMEKDPENKKHVIRLLRHFEYRNHLCLVFESLSMNLRDVLKKYGKDVGISIKAVRVYAQQLFLSLSLLKRCSILHADIKPDNVLVSESKNTLKLCDLGSASDASDNEITPYLVSRFYRAPEIIMGLSYDYAIDVWSAACTLYEMFTGKILFPGRSNNQMLKHIMEVKGRFPNKMVRKGQFGSQHFDEDNNFISVEIDRLSNKEFIKKMTIVKPMRDIKSRIMEASSAGVTEEEGRLLLAFIEFLDKCLMLSPDKRMTPKEALAHPFITGKV